MIKKVLILTAILAISTTTVLAADTSSKNSDCTKCKVKQEGQMPPRKMHHKRPPVNFEKRLNLTDAQKAKIEKQREKDRVKMEPIRKQLHEKHQAKFEIIKQYEDSNPELIKLNKEIKALKDQEHKIMEENRKSFESILTKEQKAELEKIKQEHMKKRDFFDKSVGAPKDRPQFEK